MSRKGVVGALRSARNGFGTRRAVAPESKMEAREGGDYAAFATVKAPHFVLRGFPDTRPILGGGLKGLYDASSE